MLHPLCNGSAASHRLSRVCHARPRFSNAHLSESPAGGALAQHSCARAGARRERLNRDGGCGRGGSGGRGGEAPPGGQRLNSGNDDRHLYGPQRALPPRRTGAGDVRRALLVRWLSAEDDHWGRGNGGECHPARRGAGRADRSARRGGGCGGGCAGLGGRSPERSTAGGGRERRHQCRDDWTGRRRNRRRGDEPRSRSVRGGGPVREHPRPRRAVRGHAAQRQRPAEHRPRWKQRSPGRFSLQPDRQRRHDQDIYAGPPRQLYGWVRRHHDKVVPGRALCDALDFHLHQQRGGPGRDGDSPQRGARCRPKRRKTRRPSRISPPVLLGCRAEG